MNFNHTGATGGGEDEGSEPLVAASTQTERLRYSDRGKVPYRKESESASAGVKRSSGVLIPVNHRLTTKGGRRGETNENQSGGRP